MTSTAAHVRAMAPLRPSTATDASPASASAASAAAQHGRRLGARVEHAEALGLGRRQRVVGAGDGVEEGVVLALEAVGRLAAHGLARRARGRVGAQQQRAVGAQAAGGEVVDSRTASTPSPRPTPW